MTTCIMHHNHIISLRFVLLELSFECIVLPIVSSYHTHTYSSKLQAKAEVPVTMKTPAHAHKPCVGKHLGNCNNAGQLC